VFSKAFQKADAAEGSFSFGIVAPHAPRDVSACDCFDEDWLCSSDDPYKRVWCVKDMMVCNFFLFKSFEPVVRDCIECCSFSWDTSKTILCLPAAVECGNSVADDHDS